VSPLVLALVLIRSLGGLYLVAGLTWLAALVVVFVLGAGPLKDYGPLIDPTVASLFTYGLMDTVAGLGVLMFSRRLARFAVKAVAPHDEALPEHSNDC